MTKLVQITYDNISFDAPTNSGYIEIFAPAMFLNIVFDGFRVIEMFLANVVDLILIGITSIMEVNMIVCETLCNLV